MDTLQQAQSTANKTAKDKDQKSLVSSPKVQAIKRRSRGDLITDQVPKGVTES